MTIHDQLRIEEDDFRAYGRVFLILLAAFPLIAFMFQLGDVLDKQWMMHWSAILSTCDLVMGIAVGTVMRISWCEWRRLKAVIAEIEGAPA